MNLELILTILASLVGLPMLWAFLIDVGKWAGIVTDGNAGKWSAAVNLISVVAVAIAINFFPSFDITTADARLVEIVKFAGLIFAYVIQIVGTKAAHLLYAKNATYKAAFRS